MGPLCVRTKVWATGKGMDASDLLGLRTHEGRAPLLLGLRGDWEPYCCAQAVRLAQSLPRTTAAGAEVVAASVDRAEVQLAMNPTAPALFRLVSDPDGARLLPGPWALGMPRVDLPADSAGHRPRRAAGAVLHEGEPGLHHGPDEEPISTALEQLDLPRLPLHRPPGRPKGVQPQPSKRPSAGLVHPVLPSHRSHSR